MTKLSRAVVVSLTIVGLTSLAAGTLSATREESRSVRVQPSQEQPARVDTDHSSAYQRALDVITVQNVIHHNDQVAWLRAAAAAQEEARAEALRQARLQQRVTAVSTTRRSASGHSDAWWHGVAICEQGGRNDSYFGYFSYMDGSAGGGKSWDEQVAMGNRTIAQYGDHAWAQQCINAGYHAAPGG